MPTFLQDNKMLAWILAAIAFGVAIILILKIVEIAVDLRRRLPSSARSRQLRLGFVETFDLDGERQLLLVRRDNIEHLLLIGGPNDVLVESGIVRVEPRELRAPRSSDASAPTVPLQPPMQVPAPSAAQVPAPQPPSLPLPEVAAAIETALAAAAEPDFVPATAIVTEPQAKPAPAPSPELAPPLFPDLAPKMAPEPEAPPAPPARPPAPPERQPPRFPLPPRSGPAAGPAFAPAKPLGPPPRFTPPTFAPAGQKGEAPPRPRFVMPPIARRANPIAPVAVPPPFAPEPSPFAPEPPPLVFEPSVAETPHPFEQKPEPAAPPELAEPPETHAEPVAPPEPAPSQPDRARQPAYDADFETLESLEEEMAKLLGRPLNK